MKILTTVLVFSIFAFPFDRQISPPDSVNQVELEEILRKCAQYCGKLSTVLLDFVCTERIHEEIIGPDMPSMTIRRFPAPSDIPDSQDKAKFNLWMTKIELWTKSFFDEKKNRNNEFVYDYQLIRKKNNILERRTLIEKNGKKKNNKHAIIKTRFAHKNIVYGPIALLSETAQSQHHYKILKTEPLDGDRIFVLEAVPKEASSFCHLYGKIWVRENDNAIVKIEWYEESVEGYEPLKKLAEEGHLTPEIALSTEYAHEKKGIRFPSKHSLIESYHSLPAPIEEIQGRKYFKLDEIFGRTFLKSKKEVEYTDYKFFSVETEVTVLKERKKRP